MNSDEQHKVRLNTVEAGEFDPLRSQIVDNSEEKMSATMTNGPPHPPKQADVVSAPPNLRDGLLYRCQYHVRMRSLIFLG